MLDRRNTPTKTAANAASKMTLSVTERSNFWGCVPTGQCTDCFTSVFEAALTIEEDISCNELESRLCAIPSTCGCGCETEAEIFYECLVTDISECPGIDCSAEPVCETELEAASSCLVDSGNSACPDCVSSAVEVLFADSETVLCLDFESETCTAIYDTCGCEGCAEEVEAWYDCLFTEDCMGIQCDAPVSTPVAAPVVDVPTPVATTPVASPVSAPTTAVETPLPTSSEPCYVCGMESMTVDTSLTTIFNGEEYACGDLQDWGTQRIFDEVTCQLTTLLVTKDCNCSPTTTPVGTPVASPSEIETAFPTYTDICYVCNDEDLTVTPGLTTTIDDVEYSCELVEQFGLDRLAGGTFCQLLTLLVPKDCSCIPKGGGGLGTVAPSSAPTYSEPCYVCGDPESRVDADLMVTIGEEDLLCGQVQLIFDDSQIFSPLECSLLSDLVADSCNCQGPETSIPVTTPTTDSAVSAPMAPAVTSPTTSSTPPPSPPTPRDLPTAAAPIGSVVEKSSDSDGGGGALYGLAALALIPIIAGLIVYFRRTKPDKPNNLKSSANDGFSVSEEQNDTLHETTPDTPQRAYTPQAARATAPHHHHGDGSVTASMRSEDDYINLPPPAAAVAVASLQSSGGGWSASDSVRSYDDHARRSVGEASYGSGKSHDPPATPVVMSAKNNPAPYAARSDSVRSSDNYMPDVKDQCRSLATEMSGDIIVDEVVSLPDKKQSPIDP